jgi:hypothetical protein
MGLSCAMALPVTRKRATARVLNFFIENVDRLLFDDAKIGQP